MRHEKLSNGGENGRGLKHTINGESDSLARRGCA